MLSGNSRRYCVFFTAKEETSPDCVKRWPCVLLTVSPWTPAAWAHTQPEADKVDLAAPASEACGADRPLHLQGRRDGNQSATEEQESILRGREAVSHSAHRACGGEKENGLFVNKWLPLIGTHSLERFWNPHALTVQISVSKHHCRIPCGMLGWLCQNLLRNFLKVLILGTLCRVWSSGSRWTRELVFKTASQEVIMSSLAWEPLLACSDNVSVFDQKTCSANGMGFYWWHVRHQ